MCELHSVTTACAKSKRSVQRLKSGCSCPGRKCLGTEISSAVLRIRVIGHDDEDDSGEAECTWRSTSRPVPPDRMNVEHNQIRPGVAVIPAVAVAGEMASPTMTVSSMSPIRLTRRERRSASRRRCPGLLCVCFPCLQYRRHGGLPLSAAD